MNEYLYLDASALAKLVLIESESDALKRRVAGRQVVCADIAEVEVNRAIARRRFEISLEPTAEQVFTGIYFYADDPLIRSSASQLRPASIRSLDAIHLATALRLAPELEAFICYDQRLSEAARAVGLPVESPGA